MSSAKPTCLICAEQFNVSSRSEIKCLYCEFIACRKCCETYLLTVNTAKCMNSDCGKEWTRKLLCEQFTKVFVAKTYKTHCEDVIYQTQLALMPDTQRYAVHYARINTVEQQYRQNWNELTMLRERLRTLKRERMLMTDELVYLGRALTRPHAVLYGETGETNTNNRYLRIVETDTTPATLFVRKCAQPECRGFLSNKWVCSLCLKSTCKHCHEPLQSKAPDENGGDRGSECEKCDVEVDETEPHVCNPHSVETAKLLAKDTKPCPKCQTPIFKIDGCNQMWCTQCHTAFNWITGKTENTVHNPHYYEWLRKNSEHGEIPRNPLDDYAGNIMLQQCNRINARELIVRVRLFNESLVANGRSFKLYVLEHEVYSTSTVDISRPEHLLQNVLHVQHVDLSTYQNPQINIDHFFRNLRIKYLRNLISEKEFKTELQKLNKKYAKSSEIAQILEMFTISAVDILTRFVREQKNDDVIDILMELNGLVEYTNSCLADVSNAYQCVLYNIDRFLRLERAP